MKTIASATQAAARASPQFIIVDNYRMTSSTPLGAGGTINT